MFRAEFMAFHGLPLLGGRRFGGKQRATEPRRPGPCRRASSQARHNRFAAGIVAGMATRRGDAAAEEELALRAEKKHLTGGERTKSTGLDAIFITVQLHALNRSCLLPQRRPLPSA